MSVDPDLAETAKRVKLTKAEGAAKLLDKVDCATGSSDSPYKVLWTHDRRRESC